MKIMAISLGVSVALSGCAVGIQAGDSSPSVSYTTPRSYQTVYLRAQNQAEECLRGNARFTVHAKVDPTMQTGVVSVMGLLGEAEVARTELKADGPNQTEVTQTVWGKGSWDLNVLHAMRESIRQDVSLCFAYK